jgi:quercetin dioxygenase-like cupin family protein
LLKNQGGSLTVFAFEAGQGLSEHSTPHEAAIVVLDGTATVTVGGEAHSVQTGQYLHLPGGVPHALHADVSFKMLLTMLRQSAT